MSDLPVVMTTAGAVPTDPATIRASIVAIVTASNPGYSGDLPGSLVEDILSTDVGAVIVIDQARVDAINSVTPYGANLFVLNMLGQIYIGQGFQQGGPTNTSVNVVFSGTAGFFIGVGFLVGDGTNQYIVQNSTVIGTGGTTGNVYCLASNSGSFLVPAGTVTSVVSQIPLGVTCTVTNPAAGTPGGPAQTESDYRSQVITAGLASAQGFTAYLKTQLYQVPGVQQRLVSVQQQVGGGWLVMVGGGDPYAVANAIFEGVFDVSTLVGSTISVTGITNATLGVVTTGIAHGLTNGQNNVHIAGVVGMTGVNGGPYTVAVIDDYHFTFGVNTTSSGAYVSGGVVTPNVRNQSVNIIDYPDTYTILYVAPIQQVVTMEVTWNTNSANIIANSAIQQLAIPALVAYVTSLPAGSPMNLFELQATFQQAVEPILPSANLTRMVFSVFIDGVSVSPSSGTGIIAGDPQGYLTAVSSGISVTQG
jgi:hypothetical protein